MRDISQKIITQREAEAGGILVCSPESLERVRQNLTPKGHVQDIARAAGLIAAKQTQNLIPHCHPVSIDGLQINYDFFSPGTVHPFLKKPFEAYGVYVSVKALSIGRTGIEMEALTSVAMTCLTLYDLLKPFDDELLEVTQVRLISKKGGKSDRKKYSMHRHKVAVLLCSDHILEGKKTDDAGKEACAILETHNAEIIHYKISGKSEEEISEQLGVWIKEEIPFIFTAGGTGLRTSDTTVKTVKKLIEKEAPGITEAMRAHGVMRSPVAMMSQGIAGTAHKSLIITLPGSTKGVQESLSAILPTVFHARWMIAEKG